MSTLAAPLSVAGTRHSGASVRSQNVMAASAIANIVKSSLGPVGLDKMLVDDIVEHPAAKVLVELAQLQDEEVGDGTTSVVIIAAELLKNADELVKNKIHPTSIISGYRLACKEAVKYIQDNLTVTVLVSDPEKLEAIRARELDITKERLQKILATGVNVILCTGGIDDLCLKYFVEAGAMGVRRCKKADLKRIAKATGATFLTSSMIGEAAEVVQEQICDDQLILIKGPTARSAASIILRGPTDAYCDEMERSAHDALCAVRRVLESGRLVPGGGAAEAALSIYLENFATTLVSEREYFTLPHSSSYLSLLVIPKTLAVNAARDATDLVAKLRAYHNSSQTKGVLRDNLAAGVLEPAISKIKSLKFATEAAITILRIDDMIKLDPEERGKTYQDACNAGELD
ncbi:unnamed protein product [Leptidea sinapis]|uniref:T-complex protein 1 subunit alpha n=1 Tax=Leptidea sinapis TaxID=189913 RepID=A0A5E4PVD7_9NEOP|nr:unnamed protein product [Leptidea sinapis]